MGHSLPPPTIKPFVTLVAIGVWIGSVVAMRHARDLKLDPKTYAIVKRKPE